jgi:hypothetical protein
MMFTGEQRGLPDPTGALRASEDYAEAPVAGDLRWDQRDHEGDHRPQDGLSSEV